MSDYNVKINGRYNYWFSFRFDGVLFKSQGTTASDKRAKHIAERLEALLNSGVVPYERLCKNCFKVMVLSSADDKTLYCDVDCSLQAIERKRRREEDPFDGGA